MTEKTRIKPKHGINKKGKILKGDSNSTQAIDLARLVSDIVGKQEGISMHKLPFKQHPWYNLKSRLTGYTANIL